MQSNIPEEWNLQQHRCENLQSPIKQYQQKRRFFIIVFQSLQFWPQTWSPGHHHASVALFPQNDRSKKKTGKE
jgi:hypothetical protein